MGQYQVSRGVRVLYLLAAPVAMFYGNLTKFGNMVKIGNKVQFGNNVPNWCNVWSLEGVTVYCHVPECHVKLGRGRLHVWWDSHNIWDEEVPTSFPRNTREQMDWIWKDENHHRRNRPLLWQRLWPASWRSCNHHYEGRREMPSRKPINIRLMIARIKAKKKHRHHPVFCTNERQFWRGEGRHPQSDSGGDGKSTKTRPHFHHGDLNVTVGQENTDYERVIKKKGRYLTQPFDKSPYTNRIVKKVKWQHKQRHKKSSII